MPDIKNEKGFDDDLSIRMLMEKNMFDDHLYHVDVLYPVVPSLQKAASLAPSPPPKPYSAPPRKVMMSNTKAKYQYVSVRQSQLVKSLFNKQMQAKAAYGRACIKCHALKKKCVRDPTNPSVCIACLKRGIRCVTRQDGRGARYLKKMRELDGQNSPHTNVTSDTTTDDVEMQ